MLWRDVMNPRLTDTVSVSALPADGNTLDLDLDAIPREDTLVRVVDGAGKCVGGVKRELLEYLRGTQLPERFMAILDKIDEAVIAIDREGRIYYVNPSYTKVLGVPVGRVLGRYLQRLEPSSALLTVLKPPHRPVSEKKQLIRSINKYVSIRVYPIFLHGRFQGAMSIFTDITRLNELNQEVERISQVAEEYSRQLEAETVLKQSQVIGESKVYTNSILKAVTVAKTDAAVLLRGENGVGKEVFTRILRDNSARKDKPFITVNCSAIPETLIESELFGYEEGAFTGAKRGGSMGKFQLAQGGTLLLDEIGDMPMPMQAKLLQVLDGHPFHRVGGTKPITVDVRVIAATNKPLADMAASGQFREDLFYRLRVLTVEIPPLRERPDDIPVLAMHFLQEIIKKSGLQKNFDPQVLNCFLTYRWPGNVRELRALVQSLATMSEEETITMQDLPQYMQAQSPLPQGSVSFRQPMREAVAELERNMIMTALTETGSTYKAARRLKVSQSTIVRKAQRYKIGLVEIAHK